jgi:hypothetical protein
LNLRGVGIPFSTKEEILMVDSENSMKALGNPDTHGNTDVSFLRKLVDMAVKPCTNKEENYTHLV